MPHIEDIMFKFASMVNKNSFVKETQLWFRSHPVGNFNSKRFKKFKDVKIEYPPNSFTAKSYNEIGNFKKDLVFFGNLIYHSDLIISFYRPHS